MSTTRSETATSPPMKPSRMGSAAGSRSGFGTRNPGGSKPDCGEGEKLEVTIPLPHPLLSPNKKPNRFQKGRIVANYRLDCGLATKDAMSRSGINSFPWARATVTPVFYHRERRNRDQDNATGSLKAAFDALADAGVIVNDTGLQQMPPVFEIDGRDARVVLIVAKIQ